MSSLQNLPFISQRGYIFFYLNIILNIRVGKSLSIFSAFWNLRFAQIQPLSLTTAGKYFMEWVID